MPRRCLWPPNSMSFYVTTPIYYVNGEPHLGHAYSTIAADILARHHRQRGEDVFFLTGTDEHGEPVAQQAEAEGITPRELGDRLAPRFKEMAAKINASNDFFIRTTDEGHMERVQEIVQRVYDNGHVYEGDLRGLVLPALRRLQDRVGDRPGQHLPDPPDPADPREAGQLVLQAVRRSRSDLERLYEERPDFVIPDFRRNEALSFIRQGLQDVSLSRPTLKWGVPVPWDPDQVIYVWFDALLNYYTALGYAVEGKDVTEEFWPPFHILAKDILKFHAVYWPAFLMAAEIELPKRMFIHGFLLMEGHKMSKSLGNVLDPDEVIDQVRRRRAALLLLPRGLLRPGRPDLARRLRVALRDRARRPVRQPRQPRALDDRPLPRRDRARGGGRGDARRAICEGAPGRVAPCSTMPS